MRCFVLLLSCLWCVSCATAPRPQIATVDPSRRADDASATPRQRWLEMFARGYFPGRSGQLFYVPHEGDFIVDTEPLYRFMHGSPWDYDAHIPLLLHGRAYVRRGTFADPVAQQDLAPTFAALLGIAPPATTTGRALKDAIVADRGRPRIAAWFVLDGLRADALDTYADVLPTLTRLRAEGAWFTHAHATSIPTATSIGHATLGTGTDPRIHGLVVNQLYNRVTGKPQESYNALDPGELMALTLADVWNVATDGRAVIIGQGGAIRAVAGLVGRGGCLINGRRVIAASYSTRDGTWETNDTCYRMPGALAALRAEHYWQKANGTWLNHDIAAPRPFRASAVFQRFEGDALAAVLDSEPIGADEVTDLVLVNIKSPDYVSHAYGPKSQEMREVLAELDRQMARAIARLEQKAGPDGLVVAVTSDHGMPDEPVAPRRRIDMREVVAALDAEFARGGRSIVHYFNDPANAQIHIDEARLRQLGLTLADVAAFLGSRYFAVVFTEDEVQRAQSTLTR